MADEYDVVHAIEDLVDELIRSSRGDKHDVPHYKQKLVKVLRSFKESSV